MHPTTLLDADGIGRGNERRRVDADVYALGTFVRDTWVVVIPVTARDEEREERDNENRLPHGILLAF
jgi:hypothetical protein